MNPLRTLMITAILCGAIIGNAQAETFGDFTYTDQGDTVTITGYSEFPFGAVNIPAEIGGKPVTAIGDYAFFCVGVKSLKIPGNVTSIGNSAFGSCPYLKSVSLPASVKSIGARAFSYCDGLEKLTMSSGLSSIGELAFFRCVNLAEVAIPEGVESIGTGAFSSCAALERASIGGNAATMGSEVFGHCWNLKRVTFGKGMKTIPRAMFVNCLHLTNVEMPASVRIIEDSAFSGCRTLKEVELPSSLVSIGDYAFDSTSLTTATIPSSVESIGRLAFGYCGTLKRATFLGDAPVLGEETFVSAADAFTVYWYEGRGGFTAPTWQGYPAWMVPKGPEIAVYQPRGYELADGIGKKSCGRQRVGSKSPPRTVTIRNRGSRTLRGLSVEAGGNHPDDFIIRQPEVENLPPGAATTFKVSFKPMARGSRNAVIHIRSNDSDEGSFEIHFDGHGVR